MEKCQRKKFGGEILGVVRRGACDAVGMVRNEKKGKFSPKNLGDFFRGGRIQGDVCVGDCWEIKDQIGEKKISGGPEIFGGGLFGEMPKKGWKNFLVVPKSGGKEFLGNVKKKNPRGDSLENLKKKKFRGDFLGGSYTGGRVWGECWEIKEKIGEKNFRGPEILGGELFGEMQKRGGKTFWGEVLGEL